MDIVATAPGARTLFIDATVRHPQQTGQYAQSTSVDGVACQHAEAEKLKRYHPLVVFMLSLLLLRHGVALASIFTTSWVTCRRMEPLSASSQPPPPRVVCSAGMPSWARPLSAASIMQLSLRWSITRVRPPLA